jgi:hypothetical protein
MRLDPREKAARAPRTPEPRYGKGEYEKFMGKTEPIIPFAEKQQAADTLIRRLREAGFKTLGFEAEAGERPRLYEKLTGYKATPRGEEPADQMSRVMRNFPGRQAQPAQRPAPYSQPFSAAELNEYRNMTPEGIERALGLSIDEAIDAGLARSAGPANVLRLTPEGLRSAAQWLGGTQ